MESLTIVQQLAVWALPVLLAVTLHEVAHGYAARALGDPTAQQAGRLSLNPLRHVDPVGTLLVPGILLAIGGFLFGWARPVPVNAARLHQGRRSMAWVALAGPLANLVMALGWAILLKLLLLTGSESGMAIGTRYMALAGIGINIILMVLNLLPLPPLDGSRVLGGFVPPRQAAWLDRVEPYGLIILLGLLVTGILGVILWPMYGFVEGMVGTVTGLR
ncbi:site-2 protease family protein [Algiphilus sp.]|uniref:site-2 protease family protein n=1 Tax=Algiphilus sp. TaxID=1872431 RepID=UPI003C6AC2C0